MHGLHPAPAETTVKTAFSLSQSATEIERLASEWLVRREAGLDAEAARELSAWRAADPRHEAAFSRHEATWAVFCRAQQRGDATTIVTQLRVRARRRTQRRYLTGAAVAGLALALFLGWSVLPARRSASEPGPAAPIEMLRKLPDGSLVELNVGARIDVRYEADFRRVQLLHGEAHFSVAKDSTRPFIVEVSGVEVRAVGTAFTVHLQSAAVEVVVTEGRVSVDRPAPTSAGQDLSVPSAPTLVAAGNRARLPVSVDAALVAEVSAMSEAELERRLAWRKPRIEFNELELSQAVALMNRHNRLQIVVGDAAVGRLRVSGTFLPDNPEGFVRIVEATFDLKAVRRGENEVVLRTAP